MYTDQKRKLAAMLICEAAKIVEFWEEYREAAVGNSIVFDDVTAQDVSEQLGLWLAKLPGNAWSKFLTEPKQKSA